MVTNKRIEKDGIYLTYSQLRRGVFLKLSNGEKKTAKKGTRKKTAFNTCIAKSIKHQKTGTPQKKFKNAVRECKRK